MNATQIKNSIKVFLSLLQAKVLKQDRPVFMYIHLTHKCNLRCKYCYANVDGRFDEGIAERTTEEWIKVFDESCRLGARYFHLYGGEPLVRADIGYFIDYLKKKGCLVELLSNGHLVPNKIEQIKNVDSLCLSLDGEEQYNDELRGTGNFKAVLKAVEVAKQNNIPCRLHSVINIYNVENPRFMPELAQKLGVTVSYSHPHLLDYVDKEGIMVGDEKVKAFWEVLKKMKREGYPIDNTLDIINYTINWPTQYRTYFKTEEEADRYPGFGFIPCVMGKYLLVIDSEGSMLPCLNFGVKSDINIFELGFESAYRRLQKEKKCFACSNIQFTEANAALHLRIGSMLKGLRHHVLGS